MLERASFEAFRAKPEPVAVPFQQLHISAAAIEERKHVALKWIEMEAVFDDIAQAIKGLAHVRCTAREEHPCA